MKVTPESPSKEWWKQERLFSYTTALRNLWLANRSLCLHWSRSSDCVLYVVKVSSVWLVPSGNSHHPFTPYGPIGASTSSFSARDIVFQGFWAESSSVIWIKWPAQDSLLSQILSTVVTSFINFVVIYVCYGIVHPPVGEQKFFRGFFCRNFSC